MKFFLLFVFSIVCLAQESKKDINVIYGDHHIYTVETPTNWVNNKSDAEEIGLTNIFYNSQDTGKTHKSYMYTNGYDKTSPSDDLQSFVKDDLETFLKKYPKAIYKSVNLHFEPPILNGLMLSFGNLPDRFKEEVVYLETKETVIVFSFAAFTKSDYEDYRKVFDDEFLSSFKYRGNNPKPFLDQWNKRN